MGYTTRIVLPEPTGFEYITGIFSDVEETVKHALRALGKNGGPREILFAPHLLGSSHGGDSIYYNLEQRGTAMLARAETLDNFRRHEVWDYSESNLKWWSTKGVTAKHVPLGYMPEMTRVVPAPVQDIDVLFYGVLNPRREQLLAQLKERGLNVHHAKGAFGRDRDAFIARSKIVLNVHFYETRIFEMVRCSYLFANRACVVSEESVDVPSELKDAVLFVPYEEIVETCKRLASSPQERLDIASLAFDAFTQCSETEYLSKVLQ